MTSRSHRSSVLTSKRYLTLLALCLSIVLIQAISFTQSAPIAQTRDVKLTSKLNDDTTTFSLGDALSSVDDQVSGALEAEHIGESEDTAETDLADDDNDESDNAAAGASEGAQLTERGRKHKKKTHHKKKKAHAKKTKSHHKAAAKKPSYKAQKNTPVKKGGNSGRGTFFSPGLGACGWHNGGGDSIVAISGAKWDGGKHCGKGVTVCRGSACIQAKVVDMCPSCSPGSLDLSPSAFRGLANLDLGVIGINWHFN